MLVPNPRRAVTRRNRLRDGNEDGDGCATGESSAKARSQERSFNAKYAASASEQEPGIGPRGWSGAGFGGMVSSWRRLVVPDGSAVQTAGECMSAAVRRKTAKLTRRRRSPVAVVTIPGRPAAPEGMVRSRRDGLCATTKSSPRSGRHCHFPANVRGARAWGNGAVDSVWTERRHPVEVRAGLKRRHRRCSCERRGGNRGVENDERAAAMDVHRSCPARAFVGRPLFLGPACEHRRRGGSHQRRPEPARNKGSVGLRLRCGAAVGPVEAVSLELDPGDRVHLAHLLLPAFRADGDGRGVERLLFEKIVAAVLAPVMVCRHVAPSLWNTKNTILLSSYRCSGRRRRFSCWRKSYRRRLGKSPMEVL